jgi:hypothetical protein
LALEPDPALLEQREPSNPTIPIYACQTNASRYWFWDGLCNRHNTMPAKMSSEKKEEYVSIHI